MANSATTSGLKSPKEYLKSRRPERFSDSIMRDIGRLDRAILEHHIATLNKRSQELTFEDFVKQLCERTVCPNLLEQTGPVAGGDGKVDTQTFPVSEQTKVLWYVGINDNANKDRWAFAVSTQEDWKAKCRTDVKKIADTKRDYKKCFCITNRYAKANQRSDLEDSLTSEYDIDVRILDISWILDQTFKNGYEQLAIDVLAISIDWRREVEIGPNDYAKNCRLQQLQQKIQNEVIASNITPYQVGWLLEEAVLSKELEHPEIESQGLFERAINAAVRYGSPHQQFTAHYQYAWAAYWWYEDIELFLQQLQSCFEVVKKIEQSGAWGEFITLLGLYTSYSRINSDNLIDAGPLCSGTEDTLTRMASDDARPSNSLMSKAHLEILKLHNVDSLEQATGIFNTLLEIVKKVDRLVGFPFEELYELVVALDDAFGELAEYETLLDYFTEQATLRNGEQQGALIWLKRGAKRLESGKPYQAIKLVGKSLVGLYKDESRQEVVMALNILSQAYQNVGLTWASRANLMLAASLITDEWWKSGDLVPAQVYAYMRIAKSELRLGRIDFALAWWRLASFTDANIEEPIITDKDSMGFDAYLGQCILNSDLNTLKKLQTLPDVLDEQQLFCSRAFLLYVLGYEKKVSEEYELSIDSEYLEYLQMARDLDLGAPIAKINLCHERYGSLHSSVMGCQIKVSFPLRSPLIELAETLLSVIEGFFSTGMIENVYTLESRLDIEITADDDDDVSISHELDNSGAVVTISVVCSSFTPDKLNVDRQYIIQEWLHKFVLEVFGNILQPKSPDVTLDTMLGEDRALERSVSFGACFNSLYNVMGSKAVIDVKSLLCKPELTSYDLQRSESWDKDHPRNTRDDSQYLGKPGEGEPPPELLDNELRTHSDLHVQDLIKPRLWNRTRWCGVSFLSLPDGTPGLGLLFEDRGAALAIIKSLRDELGEEDKTNRLKVSIIRKIDKKHPAHYRVCISENMSFNNKQTIQMSSKTNTMTPISDTNLNNFLEAYKKAGRYSLGFAVQKDQQILQPTCKEDMTAIMMTQLHLIDAWEIGPNDTEMMAIYEDDDPIIPDGIESPPILAALKQKYD